MRPSAGVSLFPGEPVYARYSAWLAEWGFDPVVVRSPEDLAGLGLLFLGGGGDMAAGLGAYADEAQAKPLLTYVDHERDLLELALLGRAHELRLPVFGTCRGLQVMNTYLGGTLYPDLAEAGLGAGVHRLAGQADVEVADVVHRVLPCAGEGFDVCSNHHQAIAVLAPGLLPTLLAPDGLIEAVQGESLPWRGVQWHPERMQGGRGREEPGAWLRALARQDTGT